MEEMPELMARSSFGRVFVFGDESVVEIDRAVGLKFDRMFPEHDVAAIL